MNAVIYAFDAYGTLFDVHSTILQYKDQIGDKATSISNLWRAKQREYTWTLSNMNRFNDFWSLTVQALNYTLRVHNIQDNNLTERILETYEKIALFPDVPKTIQLLRDAGRTVVIFTNASQTMVHKALTANEMSEQFDKIISVEDIKIYKPRKEVYDFLVTSLNVHHYEVILVSANRWDVAGGASAGLKTVWCKRFGAIDEYMDIAPTATVDRLTEVPLLAL